MTTTDAQPAPRRLTRSRDDRILAGVCAGIARYYDIDPVIPRVVLAVLAVFGGAGLVVYAFAWLLVPEEGSPHTRLERWLDRRGGHGRDLMVVLLVLAVLAILLPARPFGLRFSGVAFVVVVALIAAALAGRGRHGVRAERVYGPQPAPPAWQAPPASWEAPTVTWQPGVAAPRPGSWLPWATFGAALLTAGIFSVVAVTGAAHPQPADVLAACLAVVGVGLLVGTVAGRAWSMIPLGLVLAILLAGAALLPRNLTWTAGNRTWVPAPSATSATYVLGAGDAVLDLSGLDQHHDATVTSRVGAGHLRVMLPPGDAVRIQAHAGAGQLVLFGYENNGFSQDVHRNVAAVRPGLGTLTLHLDVGFGKVEVTRAAA